MNQSYFGIFLQQMLGQSPLLLVYLLGIVLCALWWRRAPQAAMLALAACGILLLSSIGFAFIQQQMIQNFNRGGGATAASYGVALCPHWFHDLHAHLVASLPNGQFVEFFPDDQVLNFRKLIDRQLEAKDGELVLPATPGLGFDFDAEAVKRYAIEPWEKLGS